MGHFAAFLPLGALDSTSALGLGVTVNGKTNRKHRNAKNVALNRLQKIKYLFTV